MERVRPARRIAPLTRALRSTVAAAVVAASLLLVANPPPARACSCVRFDRIEQYATDQNVILTGVVGETKPRGVSVAVDRWFWGVDPAIQVWLAADSFGDGAACGTKPPTRGGTYLWIAWRSPTDGDLRTGLCSPSWDLGTAEGQAQLAAVQQFFEGRAPPPPTAEPTPEIAVPDPAADARDRAALTIGAVLLGGSAALFGVLALIARSRRTGDHADR